jgi:glycosyltransferase involved in cell wall biosynthesis
MAEYLEDTIRSVLSQGYPNLEYIIVDGGSTDASVEIIRRYEAHLAWWTSEPDAGMYDALNKGFARSTGEIMAWLNADDLYHPGALLTVGEVFATLPEVRWMQGRPTFFDACGRTIMLGALRSWSRYDYYRGDFRWIQQESTFWRRGLWEEAGARVDDELRYAGDLELWARFFRYAKLHVADLPTGGFRMRPGQASDVHRATYLDEVHHVLDREVERLPPEVARRHARIVRLDAVFDALASLRVPGLGALKHKLGYRRLFGDPPFVRYRDGAPALVP